MHEAEFTLVLLSEITIFGALHYINIDYEDEESYHWKKGILRNSFIHYRLETYRIVPKAWSVLKS